MSCCPPRAWGNPGHLLTAELLYTQQGLGHCGTMWPVWRWLARTGREPGSRGRPSSQSLPVSSPGRCSGPGLAVREDPPPQTTGAQQAGPQNRVLPLPLRQHRHFPLGQVSRFKWGDLGCLERGSFVPKSGARTGPREALSGLGSKPAAGAPGTDHCRARGSGAGGSCVLELLNFTACRGARAEPGCAGVTSCRDSPSAAAGPAPMPSVTL